jgi:excisionase family DNA binding protein
MGDKKMLTTKQAGKRVGVSVWTIRRLICNGTIKADKFGTDYQIEPEALKGIKRQRRQKNNG